MVETIIINHKRAEEDNDKLLCDLYELNSLSQLPFSRKNQILYQKLVEERLGSHILML